MSSAAARWLLGALALAETVGCGDFHSPAPTPEPCEVYCTLALTRCKYTNLLYADMGICMGTCETFPTTGQDGDTAGNTLQCRTTYLLAVSGPVPMPFCQNASASGGAACQ